MSTARNIWAEAVKESASWLVPYASYVADFGRLVIPRMQKAIDAAREEGRREAYRAIDHDMEEQAASDEENYPAAIAKYFPVAMERARRGERERWRGIARAVRRLDELINQDTDSTPDEAERSEDA